ncbi:MAG: hypothetical protein AAFZ15_00670 [Bacteroidota bacterium]
MFTRLKITQIAVLMLLACSFSSMALTAAFQGPSFYEPHTGQSIFDLLHHQEVVEMTLVGELDSLINSRRTKKYFKASLSYTDEIGVERNYEIKVKPRGKFRRRVCDFPPLKLKFSKDQLEAAGLSKHNDLKLVSHCMDANPYNETLILKEYLAYKLYNELTPNSLRVQLVNITYQDVHDKNHKITQYGFVIEDVDEMADRIGGKECDNCMGVPEEQIQTSHERIMSLFQYMIGNTDYSLEMNRNVKMIRKGDDTYVPVPYDFDYSVMVGAPYLRPNGDLKQTAELERIFLGNTKQSKELTGTISYFKTKRKALLNIIRQFDHLSKRERFDVELYVDSFFDQLSTKRAAEAMINGRNDVGLR